MHSHYFLNLLSKCLKCTVKIYFLSLLADCFLFCMAPKNIKIINHLQLHSLVCIYFLIRACFSVLRHTRGRYCLFLISIRLFFFFGILLQNRWFASQAKLPWICNGHWIISTVARIERWHFAIPVNKSSSLNPNQVLFVPKLNQNISVV